MTEARSTTTGERLFRIFLVAVFVVMAVELYLLARQNRALERTVETIRTEIDVAQKMSQPPLPAGEIVAPLEVTSLAGDKTLLAYDEDRTTVLFFFSPNCPACEANVARWKRIQESADPAAVRLVWISTVPADETSAYAQDHLIAEPVIAMSYPDLARYRVFRVPVTMVVGKGGVVRNVWAGLLSDEAIAIASGSRS